MNARKIAAIAGATVAFIGAGAFSCANAQAQVLATYDPARGSLPDAQGFARLEDPGYQSPVVVGGAMHQFAQTSASADQFWYTPTVALNFSNSSYVLEASLHIISSNYIPNIGGFVDQGPRFGYYFELVSKDGRGYFLGITSQGIAIDTDVTFSPNNDYVVTPFNTTDGFHTYQLVASNDSARVFIDGNLIASTAAGLAIFPDTPYNTVFGDASGVGISESELRSFSVSTVSAIPEPSTLALLAAGPFMVMAAVRRRGKRV